MSGAESCLIFAVGSLINDASRAASAGSSGAAAPARLLPSFGASRSWCFRAVSGFTALGLTFNDPGEATAVNGCVFRVLLSELATLDARERGYSRLLVPRHQFELAAVANPAADAEDAARRRREAAEVEAALAEPGAAVYVYVPEQTQLCVPGQLGLTLD